MAFADGTEINGIFYNLVSKLKQAEVTSNPNYYSGNIDIPSTVIHEGTTYDVTKIGSRAFQSCEGLTSVSIPNSVTSIEENAFYNCKKMTNITIPNSVTSLGRKSFYNCQNLTSITIGTGLVQIGEQAFNLDVNIKKVIIKDIAKWCEISFGDNPIEWGNGRIYSDENTEITELSIPQGVNLINYTAFRGCKYLTSITIPPSVNTIKYAAFESCVGLTNIDIPNSVTYLAGFDNCTGLKTILIPTSVNVLGSSAFYGCTGFTSVDIPNSVTTIEDGAFCLTNIKEITIPNSVERIDNVAFCGCPKLTNVVIGSGIKTIGERAFAKCQEITDVYCYAEQIPQTYSDVFNNSLIEYATLHVPETAVENYKSTAPWNGFKEVVAISSSGISRLQTRGTSVKCEGGKLTVEGIDDGQIIELYSLDGEKRGSSVSKNGVAYIDTNLQPGSVAVVKMGMKSVKVIVR